MRLGLPSNLIRRENLPRVKRRSSFVAKASIVEGNRESVPFMASISLAPASVEAKKGRGCSSDIEVFGIDHKTVQLLLVLEAKRMARWLFC